MRPDTLFRDLLQSFMAAEETRSAFMVYDGKKVRRISFRRFAQDICKAAGYWKDRGLTGQHVALLGANDYWWCVAYYALILCGNIAVPLNADLPEDILQRQFADADVLFAYADPETKAQLCSAHTTVTWLGEEAFAWERPLSAEEMYCADEEETVMMLSTSGTTGKSKFVELTRKNLYCSIQSSYCDLSVVKGCQKIMSMCPFHHVAGVRMYVLAMATMMTVCLVRSYKYFFEDIPVYSPHIVAVVPSAVVTLRKLLDKAGEKDVHKILGDELIILECAGAKLNPAFCKSFLDKNVLFVSHYGMTETTIVGMAGALDERHSAAVGQLCPYAQARIEDGEILLKSAAVMKGYYKDPEETAKVLDADGWLHTGDLGYCDADGYYYITGRKKNVIILANGENVNPEELEEKFSRCPAIAESLVYSDGKGICADVYSQDRKAAEAYIAAYNENAPTYRQVYKIHFTDTPLEKTGSGKIKRKANV